MSPFSVQVTNQSQFCEDVSLCPCAFPAWLLPGWAGGVWHSAAPLRMPEAWQGPPGSGAPEPHTTQQSQCQSKGIGTQLFWGKKVSSRHLQLAGLQGKSPKQIYRDVMIHREDDKMECKWGATSLYLRTTIQLYFFFFFSWTRTFFWKRTSVQGTFCVRLYGSDGLLLSLQQPPP